MWFTRWSAATPVDVADREDDDPRELVHEDAHVGLGVVVALLVNGREGPSVEELCDQRTDNTEQPLDKRTTRWIARGLAHNRYSDRLSARDKVVGDLRGTVVHRREIGFDAGRPVGLRADHPRQIGLVDHGHAQHAGDRLRRRGRRDLDAEHVPSQSHGSRITGTM